MYYFLNQDLEDVSYMVFLGHSEESGKRLWTIGQPFQEPYPKDTFYVVSNMGTGSEMPDFFDSAAPVMSKKMINALSILGIDNFNAYPVTIQEQNTGETWSDYFAVNFVGLIDAIDLNKSVRAGLYSFHSTVVDEKKALGQLCFRLHLGPDFLVIHESIAKPLMEVGLKGIKITKTEDYDQDDI